MSTFGDLIRSRRASLRMNQREVAAKVGVKQQTVSRWESDLALPRFERLTALCEVLGISKTDALRAAGLIGEDEAVVRVTSIGESS